MSWFSPQYYHIKYSANKGESWKFLYQVDPPLFGYDYKTLLEHDWHWDKVSFKPERTSFKIYSDKYKCYQDVLDFHAEQQKRIDEGRIKRLETLRKCEERFNKNLER